jgi:hypothetical protein
MQLMRKCKKASWPFIVQFTGQEGNAGHVWIYSIEWKVPKCLNGVPIC